MAGADISVNKAGIPGCEVYINNTTRFRAVLVAEAPPAAPQIEVNGPPAKTISMSEPGLG